MTPASLVDHIARSLVDDTDAVRVSARDDGGACVVELRVAQRDLGKVIGRAGQTARAIRTVLHAAASQAHQRCVLNIIED